MTQGEEPPVGGCETAAMSITVSQQVGSIDVGDVLQCNVPAERRAQADTKDCS